jgi:Sensors of blue-light using FAD
MALKRLIYASQPFGFDDATLNGILAAARRNNRRDDITGALVCRADLYLQMLEGPETAVNAAYSRIKRDDRHLDVSLIWTGEVSERLFPAWAMRDDPARSWMWNRAEVSAGAAKNASRSEIEAVFARVAQETAATV